MLFHFVQLKYCALAQNWEMHSELIFVSSGFYIPKMMSHGYGEYEHQSSSSITHNLTHLKCKKDILVRGDVHEDVSDIVEKFIKVAHGPDALENNRARENARENIRKKLAMEAGKEKMDSCDLQVEKLKNIFMLDK